MKKNLKHRMIAMILSGMMISAPVGGTVFAADELSEESLPLKLLSVLLPDPFAFCLFVFLLFFLL